MIACTYVSSPRWMKDKMQEPSIFHFSAHSWFPVDVPLNHSSDQ